MSLNGVWREGMKIFCMCADLSNCGHKVDNGRLSFITGNNISPFHLLIL